MTTELTLAVFQAPCQPPNVIYRQYRMGVGLIENDTQNNN